MSKRAAFTITTPPLPSPDPVQPLDSVTGVRVYHGVGDTKPVASAMLRESTDLADGVTSKQYLTLDATLPANTGTPTGFPASTPAEIKSASGDLRLLGDGTIQASTARITSTTDVSLSSTTHGLQVGPTSGNNIAMDGNEIMARNNGAASQLAINFEGGNVVLGNSSSDINISGSINAGTLKDSATSTVWLNAAGTGRLQQPVIVVANRNTQALTATASGTIYYFNTTHHDIVVNQGGFLRTAVSNVARYFVPSTGLYRITYRAGFVANTTSRRALQVWVAGVESGYLGSQATGTGSWSGVLNTYIQISDPTNEYLEFSVQQNSGGTLATQTGLNAGGQIVIERISD